MLDFGLDKCVRTIGTPSVRDPVFLLVDEVTIGR